MRIASVEVSAALRPPRRSALVPVAGADEGAAAERHDFQFLELARAEAKRRKLQDLAKDEVAA